MARLVSTIDASLLDPAFVSVGDLSITVNSGTRIFSSFSDLTIGGTSFDGEFEIRGSALRSSDIRDAELTSFRLELDGAGRFELSGINITGQQFTNAVDTGKTQQLVRRAFNQDDRAIGGVNDDLLIGFQGDDTILGKAGDDTLRGSGGADRLRGGLGDDTLRGNQGKDDLLGGVGADVAGGGGGDDVVKGGAGDDRLLGNTGADTLDGGAGADTLVGGVGADTLVFR
ncbi:MAG: calcium-binding protein, partial [Pseudomonadota bacterium]